MRYLVVTASALLRLPARPAVFAVGHPLFEDEMSIPDLPESSKPVQVPVQWLMLLAILVPSAAWAHGGGLNAQGCHMNRKTGDYHCHRGAANPSVPPDAYAPVRNVQQARASPRSRLRGADAFANCAEARAAGAAPVRLGDPGYGPHLDRDNDGVGCEPYRRQR